MLRIEEHPASGYTARTQANAQGADLTVAFAVDYNTAGERLTRKVAGERYLAVPLSRTPLEAARELYRALRDRNARSLNVAGNGIYTLAQHGWTQEAVSAWVYEVLAKVHEHWPLTAVRSGGQTGVDLAGIVAGHALELDCLALMPKGFVQRGTDKIDKCHTADEVAEQVARGVRGLKIQADVASLVGRTLQHAAEQREAAKAGPAPSATAAPAAPRAMTLFFSERDPFSNWYPATFEVDGVRYACVEQYMMHRKALLFGNEQVAAQILAAPHPRQQKALGREVKGFDEGVWCAAREQIVAQGCHAKFSQNPSLGDALLATGDTMMVEASPFDRIWGVGLAAESEDIGDPSRWRGLNLLGKVLESVRSQLARERALEAPMQQVAAAATPGSVRVVSKRKGGIAAAPGETVIDGDREDPVLGNRHVLTNHRDDDERAQVIRQHLLEDYEPDVLRGGAIYRKMVDLAERVAAGERLAIACWCAPRACHCDHYVQGIEALVRGEDLQAQVRQAIEARHAAPDEPLLQIDFGFD